MRQEVFGRQLAFNVLPGEDGAAVAGEVARLLGWQLPRLTVALAWVPVFHGHTVLLRVLPEEAAGAEEIAEALSASEGVRGPSEGSAQTPLEAGEGARVEVARVRDDGLGGVWLWAVAGDADAVAAEQALRMAAELADL